MTKSNKAKVTKEVATVTAVVSKEKPVAPDMTHIKTVSGKIRLLTSMGWTRSQIATELNIIYQHVRNVQLQVLKRPEATVAE